MGNPQKQNIEDNGSCSTSAGGSCSTGQSDKNQSGQFNQPNKAAGNDRKVSPDKNGGIIDEPTSEDSSDDSSQDPRRDEELPRAANK